MLTLLRPALLFLAAAIVSIPANSQDVGAPSSSTAGLGSSFENSTDGLRRQFEEVLGAAKDHNRVKLESLVRQMEIPNSDAWFTETFGKEKGQSWAEPYSRNLAANEKDLVAQLVEIADQEGELLVRKVNEAPQSGMEAAMIDSLRRPVDVYYAGWKARAAAGGARFRNDLIGFFVYIDGRFRWNSTIRPMKITIVGSQGGAPGETLAPSSAPSLSSAAGPPDGPAPVRPGTNGVGYPECSYCPDPHYTPEARDKHVEGTVLLLAVVTAEGTAADIKVVRSLTPDLDRAAIDAVEKWRFKPARNEAHEAVPVIVPIQITFRFSN